MVKEKEIHSFPGQLSHKGGSLSNYSVRREAFPFNKHLLYAGRSANCQGYKEIKDTSLLLKELAVQQGIQARPRQLQFTVLNAKLEACTESIKSQKRAS